MPAVAPISSIGLSVAARAISRSLMEDSVGERSFAIFAVLARAGRTHLTLLRRCWRLQPSPSRRAPSRAIIAQEPTMSDAPPYTPPKVWTWNKDNGGRFANINRPTAGAQKEQAMKVGKHPLQLYSLATPNGVKVTIMLEELLALGHGGPEYDAWMINIGAGG